MSYLIKTNMNNIGVITALGVLCFDCTIVDQPMNLKLRDHEIVFKLILTTLAFGKKGLGAL